MLRRLCIVIGVVLLPSVSADLNACGDKFLRVGRSARYKHYAAVHPASILIYAPANSTSKGIQEFEAVLKRAGHKPRSVKNGTGLAEVFATAKYDVVIAAYADTGRIRNELNAVSATPRVLPVLDNPTKAVAAEVANEYPFCIRLHTMTKYDALEEIDRLLDSTIKQNTLPPSGGRY
jgi:hypothetical protein